MTEESAGDVALADKSADEKLHHDTNARRVKLRQLTLKSNQIEDL